ncbi:hypothetical protein, partial [Edwardsiella piscicida]
RGAKFRKSCLRKLKQDFCYLALFKHTRSTVRQKNQHIAVNPSERSLNRICHFTGIAPFAMMRLVVTIPL